MVKYVTCKELNIN